MIHLLCVLFYPTVVIYSSEMRHTTIIRISLAHDHVNEFIELYLSAHRKRVIIVMSSWISKRQVAQTRERL
jgi:hypothetical protein